MRPPRTEEHQRLADSQARKADWKNWGTYLSERAWGTVREDYSPTGEAWEYFPHDHARSRAYRWNEDGLGGFCNRMQNICLAVALWNQHDPILKERLFGLTGNQGNHGEDVKEIYYYLDNTPTHTYAKMLYRYPQAAYPYQQLVEENQRRERNQPEFELVDALPEVFAQKRYFDVLIEYAKAGQQDILCRITAINRGPEAAPIHILPHIWFRNTWSWGYPRSKPVLHAIDQHTIHLQEPHLGERWWAVQAGEISPRLLFTENETNFERLFGAPNASPYVKDAFHQAVIDGDDSHINPQNRGTKAAAHFQAVVPPGEKFSVEIRLSDWQHNLPFVNFQTIFDLRIQQADQFYDAVQNPELTAEQKKIQRQAFAGLLWSKQFYHYGVSLWLDGDPGEPLPPEIRKQGRNHNWTHLYNLDVLSMPDKWEYPWYAAWDLAFHSLPLAMIDPEWAKRQLILILREWYMHPNGQIPAYEWAFGDVNPPVHAWAAWRVYKISRKASGVADTDFLERIFQKLLLNFTWWINRKDADDRNIFQGGFLGLDNIGVFDRSAPLPTGGHLEQADSTAWMGMYCLNMLAIALELARTRPAYEDMATKFFEHFIYIAQAINQTCGDRGLWDPQDGFYYDLIHTPDDRRIPLRIRSFVGLIPLFAVETLDADLLAQLPRFKKRMDWFIKYRPHLVENIASLTTPGLNGRRLLSIVNREQLQRVLAHMLDEDKFLSPYGLRSLSREHLAQPFTFSTNDQSHTVSYQPGESTSGMFGGNSNWRGPIWFPVNYLMIESLQKFGHYYGADLQVALPTGSKNQATLDGVARALSHRLSKIFLQDERSSRPYLGNHPLYPNDPDWQNHLLFYEYFHGDNGTGLGASHQTGWTALIAKILQQSGGPGL